MIHVRVLCACIFLLGVVTACQSKESTTTIQKSSTSGSSSTPAIGVPQFSDYHVNEIFTGKPASLVLTKKDAEFQTQLREASTQKLNFAGHYVLTSWGCGSQCLMGAVIDAQTGKVFWIPHTICCWMDTDDKFQPIAFRLDSTLIVFSGLRNEKDGDNGEHYYKFENNQFVFIRSIAKNQEHS